MSDRIVEFHSYPKSAEMPNPPKLHWVLLLVIIFVTFGLFTPIWLLVQSNWVRKVTGSSKSFGWALAYLLYLPATIVLGIFVGVYAILAKVPVEQLTQPLDALSRICAVVLAVSTAFSLKHQLENSPINIPLSGVMTFFFSSIYFQYHLNDFQWQSDHAGTWQAHTATGSLGLSGPGAPSVRSDTTSPPTGS